MRFLQYRLWFMSVVSLSICRSFLHRSCGNTKQRINKRFLNAPTTTTWTLFSTTRTTQAVVDERMAQQNPPIVVVIAGPTATGKSDVAARLCRQQKGMIVSADSVQAYRGVQIGANKPTLEERTATPHVLIDVADHKENYNAAEWREDAIFCIQTLLLQERAKVEEDAATIDDDTEQEYRSKIKRQQHIQRYIEQSRQEILSDQEFRQKVPILPVVCGGTMMYLQWLVHGRPDACRPTPTAVRESYALIEKFQKDQSYHDAVQYVASFGDVFANRTQQFCGDDWYRLRRTLEIALTVKEQHLLADKSSEKMDGINVNHWDNEDVFIGEEGSYQHLQNQVTIDKALVDNLFSGQRQGGLASLGYDVRCFFLCPDDRMSHTRVVDERCEQMIINGLIQETTDLKLSGCLPEMAERAIGYRQTLEYLYRERREEETEEELFESFLNDFTTATRRYAKKQMAWFRKDEEFVFVPVPLQLGKADRVDLVSRDIKAYCQMSREDYEKNLESAESKSAQCKKENEGQGKAMKFYQFNRYILKPGSQEYMDALAEAVACRDRIRASLTKKRTIDEVV